MREGYQLSWNDQLGSWVASRKNAGSCWSDGAHKLSNAAARVRICMRYRSGCTRSSGVCVGHTFGANQPDSALESASDSERRCGPTMNDSLRSGGVSVPSEYPFASAPIESQPRPPTLVAYYPLVCCGRAKKSYAAARTVDISSAETP